MFRPASIGRDGRHQPPPQAIPRLNQMNAQPPWALTRPSQRSLHNAPIFRLLLKVAVNGTHQCDCHNFCGGLGPQQGPPSNQPDIRHLPGDASGILLRRCVGVSAARHRDRHNFCGGRSPQQEPPSNQSGVRHLRDDAPSIISVPVLVTLFSGASAPKKDLPPISQAPGISVQDASGVLLRRCARCLTDAEGVELLAVCVCVCAWRDVTRSDAMPCDVM